MIVGKEYWAIVITNENNPQTEQHVCYTADGKLGVFLDHDTAVREQGQLSIQTGVIPLRLLHSQEGCR